MTQPNRKWHESAAGVAGAVLVAVIVTSPCWAAVLITALIVWSKR